MPRENHRKTARLEARLTAAAFALVQRAANLQGRSVSDFVTTAAQSAAEEVIEKHDIIRLSRDDQARFAEAFLHPAPLAPALKRAIKAHRKLIDR